MTEKEIIKGLEDFLKKKYGDIPPQFNLILEVVKNNLHRYLEVKEDIDTNGIIDATTKSRHSLLTLEYNLSLSLMRLCSSLGISPLDSARLLKVESSIKASDEEEDDFIDSLTK